MGIRVQPMEVCIPRGPGDDPFENDLLDRREKAEVLTSLVSNIDGPCTMAVDAAWGAGKTTFLKMWAQHLRNENFPIVEFNAWETDASGDPFLSLTSEITQGLRKWPDRRVQAKLKRVENEGKKWLARLAPAAIRLAASPLPIAGPEVGHSLSTYAGKVLSRYVLERESASQFKSSLQDLAKTIWESTHEKPIVLLIDELDRCRPTYAIELLETAKHIFGVDHAVFVWAVNREQLAHSVRALYGERFDAEGYLRRFFDIDFRLPAPDRQKFIRNSLELIGVDELLKNSIDPIAQRESGLVLEAFASFFGQDDLSLRSVGQAIHRFGAVLASLGDKNGLYLPTLTVLSILSAVDPTLYRQFVQGELTADQTIETLFKKAPYCKLRRTGEGALLEAVLIAEGTTPRIFPPTGTDQDIEDASPILGRYVRILTDTDFSQGVSAEERRFARMIYDWVLQFHNRHHAGNFPFGFAESVQRLELLSPDLKGPSA